MGIPQGRTVLTSKEADPPEARVQGHFDLRALVLRKDDAFLQVQPIVRADCDAQQAQTADSKDTAQQGQGLPPTGAHLRGWSLGSQQCCLREQWAVGTGRERE